MWQRFLNFFDYGPRFSSGIVGGAPTLVTVQFTAKYSNSSATAQSIKGWAILKN